MKQHFLKYGGLLLGMLLLCAFCFPDPLLPTGIIGAFALPIFTRVCGKNVSGAQAIYVAEKGNVTAITVTGGEISAITGTTPFMKTDIEQDSLKWDQNDSTVGHNNIKIDNNIEYTIAKPTKEMNTYVKALHDASPCGLYAIITDGNGQNWLVGYDEVSLTKRPLRFKEGKQTTGKKIGDEDGQVKTIQLANEALGLALPFDSTLNAAINAGTSTIIKWS